MPVPARRQTLADLVGHRAEETEVRDFLWLLSEEASDPPEGMVRFDGFFLNNVAPSFACRNVTRVTCLGLAVCEGCLCA
jgi:hypothetical protein